MHFSTTLSVLTLLPALLLASPVDPDADLEKRRIPLRANCTAGQNILGTQGLTTSEAGKITTTWENPFSYTACFGGSMTQMMVTQTTTATYWVPAPTRANIVGGYEPMVPVPVKPGEPIPQLKCQSCPATSSGGNLFLNPTASGSMGRSSTDSSAVARRTPA
ncbi:MAG: hypothetical protein Q9227_004686 [Pyrenula ochraceoflavens]